MEAFNNLPPVTQVFLIIYLLITLVFAWLSVLVATIQARKVKKLLREQEAKKPWSIYYYSQQGHKDWLAWVDSLKTKKD